MNAIRRLLTRHAPLTQDIDNMHGKENNTMEARVSFSEEFEDMTKQKLTNRQKGELRMKLLKERADEGGLALCRNRDDVAKLVGFTDEQVGPGTAGSTWTTRIIKLGKLHEVLVKKNGRNSVYEYFLPAKAIVPAKVEKKPASAGTEVAPEPAPTPEPIPAPAMVGPVVTTAADGSKNISFTLTINLNSVA